MGKSSRYPYGTVYVKEQKSYGFWKFLGDCFMVVITCGFWFIWIIVLNRK